VAKNKKDINLETLSRVGKGLFDFAKRLSPPGCKGDSEGRRALSLSDFVRRRPLTLFTSADKKKRLPYRSRRHFNRRFFPTPAPYLRVSHANEITKTSAYTSAMPLITFVERTLDFAFIKAAQNTAAKKKTAKKQAAA
jgi:hypothetical protein